MAVNDYSKSTNVSNLIQIRMKEKNSFINYSKIKESLYVNVAIQRHFFKVAKVCTSHNTKRLLKKTTT